MMKEALATLWSLMNSSWCARRKEPPVTVKARQNKGCVIEKPPSSAIDERTLASEGPASELSTIKRQSASGLELDMEKDTIKKLTSLGAAVAREFSSKQLLPAVTSLKATSDPDLGSTTAGSGDLTEDDHLYESSSDFEAIADRFGALPATTARMTTSSATVSAPGLAPPPGLEHPGLEGLPGLEHPVAHTTAPLKGNFSHAEKSQGMRFKSQAMSSASISTTSDANKINTSSEFDVSTGKQDKFTGATHYLQESLAQLKDALAHYETHVVSKDDPALASTEAHTAEIMSKISNLLGNATAGNKRPQVVKPIAVKESAVAKHAPWNIPKQQKQMQTLAACIPEAEASVHTLRSNLQELDRTPPERVLIVRRIYRLGLDSPTLLKTHFEQYGSVDKVLVSHSRNKSRRVRPAGLGFILMSSAEEAAAILNFGHEQVVCGALITVQAYETRHCELASQDETDQDKAF